MQIVRYVQAYGYMINGLYLWNKWILRSWGPENHIYMLSVKLLSRKVIQNPFMSVMLDDCILCMARMLLDDWRENNFLKWEFFASKMIQTNHQFPSLFSLSFFSSRLLLCLIYNVSPSKIKAENISFVMKPRFVISYVDTFIGQRWTEPGPIPYQSVSVRATISNTISVLSMRQGRDLYCIGPY